MIKRVLSSYCLIFLLPSKVINYKSCISKRLVVTSLSTHQNVRNSDSFFSRIQQHVNVVYTDVMLNSCFPVKNTISMRSYVALKPMRLCNCRHYLVRDCTLFPEIIGALTKKIWCTGNFFLVHKRECDWCIHICFLAHVQNIFGAKNKRYLVHSFYHEVYSINESICLRRWERKSLR